MKLKKIIIPFIAIAAVLFVTGCSEKFNIAAPYKNITVVYAFLDKADTAHYIRIQKAFLDQNKNAVTMAKDPDSSFYQNISVRMERYTFTTTGAWTDTIHLNRVDLDLEGYPKQPGIFFNSPNYAYKFTNTLDPNYIYRLKVTNLTTGEIDSADAPVIEDIDTTVFNIDAFTSGSNIHGMDFSSTFPNRFYEFGGTYVSPVNFIFENLNSPVTVSQAVIRFNWADSDNLTHALTYHYYDFNLGYQAVGNGQIDYRVKNNDLYSAIKTGMGAAPANTTRLLDRCLISVYLSTADYNQYQQNSLILGTGLTGSEIEPAYTNIKGKNALGLYTSKGVRSGFITITPPTVDSLIISPYLQEVKIVGTTYHQ